MDIKAKSKIVEGLMQIASDETTNPWSGRIYMAAAHWLEAELMQAGGPSNDPDLMIAGEKVEHRELGAEPFGFRDLVNTWLNPAKYG